MLVAIRMLLLAGRKDNRINLIQDQYIQENGKAISEMAMESRCGKMVPSTLVNGEITKLMVRENSSMLMEIFIRANGQMIKQMATESIST